MSLFLLLWGLSDDSDGHGVGLCGAAFAVGDGHIDGVGAAGVASREGDGAGGVGGTLVCPIEIYGPYVGVDVCQVRLAVEGDGLPGAVVVFLWDDEGGGLVFERHVDAGLCFAVVVVGHRHAVVVGVICLMGVYIT